MGISYTGCIPLTPMCQRVSWSIKEPIKPKFNETKMLWNGVNIILIGKPLICQLLRDRNGEQMGGK